MKNFELVLQHAGFTAVPTSQLESLIGRRVFSLDMTAVDTTRMPARGRHHQGTLNLHVELCDKDTYFNLRLEGVHPRGYGFEVAFNIVPLSDIQSDYPGKLAELEAALVQSWLATCPTE